MRYFRKILQIKATDSPNVRLGLAQLAAGETPTDEVLVPGVLTYGRYAQRRATWDKIRQCVGLDAEFYEGAEVLLFPPERLNLAERRADDYQGRPRRAVAIGIDPAEGGDSTAMAAVDELGLIELVSKKTPDTSVITGEAIAFMRKHGVEPEQVVFDRGGGGKEHADRLREQGFNVRTVAFGESLSMDPKRGMTMLAEKIEIREEQYAYKNRRAQMYGELSLLLDPTKSGWAIPRQYSELRRQLAPIPRAYDAEGRLELPPKNRRAGEEPGRRKTLTEMIGHSPDEADAVVLAVHAMLHKGRRVVAGG